MKIAQIALALGLLPLLLPGAGCAGESEAHEVLTFTAIPDDNATALAQRFQPLADYLSEQLKVDVRYLPTSSYEASVEAFKNGDVQLAWFGGLTWAQARAAVPGAEAIAQGAVDPKFKSYFIAHKDSGVEPSKEFPQSLAGKTFTFGAATSTSGRLMPEYFIRKETGKTPAEFFGRENSFASGHDQTAELVEAGTFQAGALNYKSYDRLVADGKVDPAVARIVWTTPEYADYNFTAHPALESTFEPGFTQKLRDALVAIKDPELLKSVDRSEGLIPATNADFETVDKLARELGFVR
jgi:phosphonate transport system substrate-binding protein